MKEQENIHHRIALAILVAKASLGPIDFIKSFVKSLASSNISDSNLVLLHNYLHPIIEDRKQNTPKPILAEHVSMYGAAAFAYCQQAILDKPAAASELWETRETLLREYEINDKALESLIGDCISHWLQTKVFI